VHVVFDNESLLSVGGFPTATSTGSDIASMAAAAGVPNTATVRTLDDDPLSQAHAINARGQVVGVSFGTAAGARAFLYENGVLSDLNDLIESDDVFLSAQDINDAGQITGRLLYALTGETLMFVATPAE
jgi:probable HAF family extracellular repeat protein